MLKVKNASSSNVMLIDGTVIKPKKTANVKIDSNPILKDQVNRLIKRGILDIVY